GVLEEQELRGAGAAREHCHQGCQQQNETRVHALFLPVAVAGICGKSSIMTRSIMTPKARPPRRLVPSGDPRWRLPGTRSRSKGGPSGRAQKESHSSSHSEFSATTLKLCDPSFRSPYQISNVQVPVTSSKLSSNV